MNRVIRLTLATRSEGSVWKRMIAARYFSLCCAEPFRIFFPFGVLIGISGVSLWPLFFSGLHKFYPGVMHGRLMIEGFMGAFVIGFLGTAAPRLTGTPSFSRTELITQLLLLAAVVGTHIAHQHFLGDLLFLVLLLFFGSRIAWRFAQRTELPPPTFALVAFGFCNAMVGTFCLLAPRIWDGFARAASFGSLLLYQGFLLYLLLGVGGFLLPRFLVLPAKPELPDIRELSKPWIRRAAFATAIGMVILASFVVEVIAEASRAAGAMRFAAALVYLLAEVPVHLSAAKPSAIGRSLHLAVVFLVIGLLFPVLWPWQRVAGLHLVFIGTFTLIAFTVATRVILGHSGQLDSLARPMPFLRATAALLLAAAVLRVAGDFILQNRGTLLDLASYAWMIAAAIWAWWIVPNVRIPDPES